ncbi:MAG TPA: hypothetical protein VF185_02215, partial [Patescibacteria group bacterium]
EPTINQTGSATGDYTALNVKVTETAATGARKYLADFQVGSTSMMVLTSAGNLGVGVTNPSYYVDAGTAANGGVPGGRFGLGVIIRQNSTFGTGYVDLNANGHLIIGANEELGTQSNAAAASWQLYMSSSADTVQFRRIAAGGGATTSTYGELTTTGLAVGNDVSLGQHPLNRLDIYRSSTSTASAMIRNTSTSAGIAGLAIKLSSTTLDNTSRFVNFLDLNGTIIGKIQAADTTSVNYAANGTDMAEYFTKDSSVFTPGDLVSQGTNGATLTTSTYDSKMIGIVSTAPSFTGGVEGPNKVLVALVGQVPVKISSASQPINPGDYITSSSEAGKAMKAINPGYTIGKALEAWDPSSGKTTISVAIHNSYFEGDLTGQIAQLKTDISNLQTDISLMKLSTQSASVASDSATFKNLTATGNTLLSDTVVNGKLNVGMLTLDNTDSSINAIGTLKIQSLALGSVDIMNGKVVIDASGNVTINGDLTVLGKMTVANDVAGKAVIVKGATQVTINSTKITSSTLIYLTPTSDTGSQVLYIRSQGAGFANVGINNPIGGDATFNWWIVETK